jgi:hypothetical protein
MVSIKAAVVVVVSAVFSFSTFACSSGNGTGSGAAANTNTVDVATMCRSFCNDNHTCDETIDQQTCQDNCTNSLAVQWDKMRSDFVNGWQSCYQATDCAAKLDGSATSDCINQELASIAPSGTDTAFCSALKSSATTCGESFSDGDCLNLTKEFGDAALKDAQSCTSKACSAIPSCVEAALPGYKL